MIIVITISTITGGKNIKAVEENPAYLITNDYIIIDHVKYDLVNNRINYLGLEFELNEGTLTAYDSEGVENIIVLPVEQNKITDEKTIEELNAMVGLSNEKLRALPSKTVNLPYKHTLSNNQWCDTTPAININIPGKTEIPITNLKITGMAWNANKHFSIGWSTGDVNGNWYGQKFINDYDFRIVNLRRFVNMTATRYEIFTLGNLAGETGYTYEFFK